MVSENWRSYKLTDIVEIVGGGTPRTSIPEYWDGDIPWISVVDFQGEKKYIWKTEKHISRLGLENSSTKILKRGQVIISARGTVGELAILGEDMAFNQSCYGLNANNLTSNEFVYYLLKHNISQIKQKTNGAVFDTITRETLDHINIELPSLSDQQHIVEILSALDDKIELNRQTNATLEAIAQAIFKEWFVDFNYPGATGELVESELGLIPKGWSVKPLDEIANFLNGLALQKYPPENENEYLPVIKIRELKQGVTESSDRASRNLPKDYIIQDGDLLFSWSGSLEVKFWVGGEGALNQHLFKVTSKECPLWFCYYWILYHLPEFRNIAEEKTTTMGHIKREHLSRALCLIPGNLTVMDDMIRPIINKVIKNNIENCTLIVIRNNLLPKLMNGEVEL